MRTATVIALVLLSTSCSKDDDKNQAPDKKDRKGKRDRKRDRDDDDDDDRGYMKKAKKSEAVVQLRKIAMRAKEEQVTTGSFAVAKIPLTPSENCCTQNFNNKRKCSVTNADWAGEWRKLDFAMEEPFLFQYSYESDGKTFIAKAVGDLDCDTTSVTYEVRGTVQNGNPVIETIEPPPNSD